MTPKINYTQYSKEELIAKIIDLKKRKKYGLVWDEEKEPENVVQACKKQLPILKQVKTRAINSAPEKPTHILIEGDNYHSLSVLNYTHQNAIDVIYIDPPYNKGNSNEWKYNDKWIDINDSYRHSKWLSFISKRLAFAKNLLTRDGVIFISIDDNAYAHLKLLLDEIFSEKQFVGTLIWEKKKKGSHLNNFITNVKEYVLVYCKNPGLFSGLIGQTQRKKETYPCINPGNAQGLRIIPKGIKSNFKEKKYTLPKGSIISAGNMSLLFHSDLIIKDGFLFKDVKVESEWRYTQKKIDEFAENGALYITTKLYFRHKVTKPRYKKLKDLLLRVEKDSLVDLQADLIKKLSAPVPDKNKISKIKTKIEKIKNSNYKSFNIDDLYQDGWGSNEDGDSELREFFGKKIFDYPKPYKLIQKLIASTQKDNCIVLDFFAGTGTTAQSVLNLAALGKNISFILCTNNEDNNANGLKIASDICYPRIKKLFNGYKKRNGIHAKGFHHNLKYFKTAFIPAKATDRNKAKLTKQSVEMLCLKEHTFEQVLETDIIKIFKNNYHYTAILFDDLKITEFKKQIKNLDLPVNIYIFSLGDDDFAEEFADLKGNIKACSIPTAILRVYKRIFR